MKSFIRKIKQCKCVLSTSLHEIIIAHAYGIPAIWIKHGWINSSEFKFYDYFSAVDIPQYDGFTNYYSILQSIDAVNDFFESHKDLSIVKPDILRRVQKNLIDSLPYAHRDTQI